MDEMEPMLRMVSEVEGKSPSEPALERADSEYECELMIEALRRELGVVREQLALLTNQLDLRGGLQVPNASSTSTSPSAGATEDGVVTTERKTTAKKTLRKAAFQETKVEKSKEEKEAEQLARQRQLHYLGVVDRVETQRWDLSRQCLRLMEQRIEQQLQQLQEASERLHRRRRRRENREKAARLQLKPARFRSVGEDDRSFLTNVYQGTFYQIVDMEHQLRRTGQLKSLADLKEFWDYMLVPRSSKSPPPPPKPHPQPHPPPVADDDDEEYSNSWAITALAPHYYRDSSRTTPFTDVASKSTRSTPIKFVPMKLPELKPVSDILNEGRPDHEPERRAAHAYRMQELSGERRRVRHMYQQARANEMAMRRLLPDVDTPMFDASPLPPSPSHLPRQPPVITSSPKKTKQTKSPLIHASKAGQTGHMKAQTAKQNSADSIHQPVTTHPSRSKTSPTSPRSSLSRHPSSHPPQSPPAPTPALSPLTMESVLQSGSVKEFKGKSALWCNYVAAGK